MYRLLSVLTGYKMGKPIRIFQGIVVQLYIINALTALSYSLIIPVMTLFLVQHLKMPPIYIGLYTVGVALSAIAFSQLFGALSDRGVNAKKLYMIALISTVCAAMTYASSSYFGIVLATGITLMGLGNASMPQFFIITRRYAEQQGRDVAQLNALMRSGMSLVWIIGPGIAFTLLVWQGFSTNFYLAAIIALLSLSFASYLLPDIPYVSKKEDAKTLRMKFPPQLWILGVVVLLVNMSNSLYITAMPLYVSQELNIKESFPMLPGILFGISAASEIPIMLYTPHWARNIGHLTLFSVGVSLGVVFYVGFFFADTVWQWLSLQLINGIYYGIFCGLGITLVQEAIPDRVGFSSAFYASAMRLGAMAGSALTGIIAQILSFHVAVLFASLTVLVAMVLMLSYQAYIRFRSH